jgi:hypothetical protein
MWKLRSPSLWWTKRTFSSRYVSILAPTSEPVLFYKCHGIASNTVRRTTQKRNCRVGILTNCNSMNLPKRDELSFRRVRAFPKASRIGLDSRTNEENQMSKTTLLTKKQRKLLLITYSVLLPAPLPSTTKREMFVLRMFAELQRVQSDQDLHHVYVSQK